MHIYQILLHLHSWIRWIFLLSILYTILYATWNWLNKKGLPDKQKRFGTITTMMAHLQLILGFALYIISPKVKFDTNTFTIPIFRFFTLEHIILMLVAIAIITIGNSKIKKTEDTVLASKRTVVWFSIGLIIILAAIPWPFRNMGTGWF